VRVASGCQPEAPSAADVFPGRRVSECPCRAGRRARQQAGIEVPDLIDAFGELPAVAGALVAAVVDGVSSAPSGRRGSG
jgi:hypothetical protein